MACDADLKLLRAPLVTDVKWQFKDRTYCDDSPSLTITDYRAISDIFDKTSTRKEDGTTAVNLSGVRKILNFLHIDFDSPYIQSEFVHKYLPELACDIRTSIPAAPEEEVEGKESDSGEEKGAESSEEGRDEEEEKSSGESSSAREPVSGALLTFEEVLSFISVVYAPAYAFGRELRRAVLRADTTAIQQLIARGCNPSKLDGEGMNAAHYAAEAGSVEGLEAVLKAWPALELNEGDRCGWTPCLIASSRGHLHFLRHLLHKQGNLLSKQTRKGRNALHCAVLKGHGPIVKFLLQQSSSLKGACDSSSLSVLHFAAINGDKQILDLLLASGANKKAKDALGRTYVDYLSED